MAPEKPITIQRGSYTVQKLPAIPSPFETHPFIFKTSILTTWSLWVLYTACQLVLAIRFQYTRQEHVQWAVVISEILLDFPSAVLAFSIVLGLFSVPDEGPRPRYSLLDGPAPDVDVLVTCCGESVGVISNTAAAAATQDYPANHLRVYVLDDGGSEELCSAIERLNLQIASRLTEPAPIIYLSRKLGPGEHSHFKSGNLRFGIHESQTRFRERSNRPTDEGEPPDRFIACLDADMIPTRDWLRKMVPHMLLNDDLGIVCPPQNYYNIPKSSLDILGQQTDFDIYFSVQEALNDRLGAAMCTGSGYVARRSALESIGGWPLANCGEDYMCSTILSDQGWGIAFVREKLQSGLAPANMTTLLKQRMRWTDAGIEVHQRLGYYLPGSSAIASRMTPGQRAVNMLYVLRDFSPLGITFAMIALPLAILLSPKHENPSFTEQPADNNPFPLSSWLKYLATAVWITQKANTWVLYRHLGLVRVMNFQSQEVWSAPYSASRNLAALLPLPFPTPSFAVCGATTSPLNESSPLDRKPLSVRLLTPQIISSVLYIAFVLAALFLHCSHSSSCFLRYDAAGLGYDAAGLGYGVGGLLAVFPGARVKLVGLAAKVALPVGYMIWPPDLSEWVDLVAEDGGGVDGSGVGVRRPRERRENGEKGSGEGKEKGKGEGRGEGKEKGKGEGRGNGGREGREKGEKGSWMGWWWVFVWGCELGVLWSGGLR